LLRAACTGQTTLLATVALCIEYEGVCSRVEHVAAASFNSADLTVFLNAVVSPIEPIQT